jgi:outer membrane protein OmpA-like peptidoglycan-associated protein
MWVQPVRKVARPTDAVAAFLRQNGISIPVQTAGKGATEPISDSAGLTQDDIYLLNRRVEWVCE